MPMVHQFRPGAVDMHAHVTPANFPACAGGEARWPCMDHHSAGHATILMGEIPFRELDSRSWDVARRIEDMDDQEIAVQVLSPMPELLSYWFSPSAADVLADYVNQDIARQVSRATDRFVGFGTVPLQDGAQAIRHLERIQSVHGLSGVEIGSNINGKLLGDPEFDPFFEAAEALGLPIFVHALHPVATKNLNMVKSYVPLVGFPVDLAMTAASLIMAGTLERYPSLRIGFSHGGGGLAPVLHRMDFGWSASPHLRDQMPEQPSRVAARMFFDSNVYSPDYLRYLCECIAPEHVFLGTDYPYAIMQDEPLAYVARSGLSSETHASVLSGAAYTFLNISGQASAG